MDDKIDWTFVKEEPLKLSNSYPSSSRSIKISPSNRSFSEYLCSRSHIISRSQPTPSPPKVLRTFSESFVGDEIDNSLDEVSQEEENSRSIERRFTVTEGYVGKEGTPIQERLGSPRSISKMFEKKVSALNKEIGRLEAENWTLRNERHETGKIISEQR